MITIYHNPRCQKSREGLKFLQQSGQDFKVIEYLKAPFSEEELRSILSKLQIKPLDLIRKNEAIWKSDFRGKPLTDNQIIQAMLHYPKLIERPIIANETLAIIGRPVDKIQDIL